jgi:hypothetical protein
LRRPDVFPILSLYVSKKCLPAFRIIPPETKEKMLTEKEEIARESIDLYQRPLQPRHQGAEHDRSLGSILVAKHQHV